jgi:electron transfer flavoprotein beta subunit
MNVVVCVKQIPDPAGPSRLKPDTFTLDRSDKIVLDDSDTFGVEMGLQLRDGTGAGEVTLVSMGADSETAGLRTAFAMGADRAVLVSDPQLAGSDALTTAKVLAAAIRRLTPDLVIAATESTDGYTGTVPVQVAELLGMPSVSFARSVRPRDGGVSVSRQTDAGFDEVECPLPAVITVTAGVVEPRYPSFRGIVSAKTKPIEVLTLSDLGMERHIPQQMVTGVEIAEARSMGELIHDDGTAHERVIALLEQLKLV